MEHGVRSIFLKAMTGAVALGAILWMVARREVSVSEATVASAGVVDSAIPREEALRRFREGIPPIDSLEGGASSMAGLVQTFVRALEAKDTTTLRRLVLTRREFAWTYYETNPQSLPPYDLEPSLFWFLLEGGNRGGLVKLLESRGGFPLEYLRFRCGGEPSRQGRNVVHGPCAIVRRTGSGDSVVERIFGPIVERDGRWKFVTYASKLD